MYYYAYVDSNYKVTGVYALPTEMTIDGYIPITEEQYNSGNLVNKYYNPITGNFDEPHDWTCDTTYIQYKRTNVTLEEKLDAMDEAIEGKADENHTHTEYANAIHNHDTDYADINHTHTGYAVAEHTHTGFVTTETYTEDMSGKANASHSHAEYVTTEAMNTALGGKANADHTHDIATETASGLMGYADKVKLNGIENGANNYTHPETHSSEMITGLSNVATSGSYNDLSDTPTIPTSLPANGGNADTVDGKNADDFATADHTHTQYATNAEVEALETAVNGKANATHTHSEYASNADLETVETVLGGKANTSHTHAQSDITGLSTALAGKAASNHTHDYAASNHTHAVASTTADGLLSQSDKAKLDSIATGANKTTVDSSLSSTSTNPVQNKVINTALASKANSSHTHAQSEISGLATVLSSKANTSHTHAQNEVTGLSTALNGKVDKVDGKALSTNDYTTAEKNKLAGIATGANAYTHPSYTAKSSGLYKVTVDGTGHISGTTAVAKSDITALGIPAQDTVYTHPSTHSVSMISGLAGVATSGSYNDLSNKPTSMTPTAHTHSQSEISGLAEALNSKAPLNSIEVLETGTNLNNYTTAGMYSFSVSSAPLNMPSGCTNGWLIVIPWCEGSATVKQVFLRHGTPNSTDFFTYTRMYTSSGGWSDWSTYYTTSNPPTAAEVGAISKDLLFTNSGGGVEYSYGSGSGKNVLTEISNMPQGFHTIYAIGGTSGNPETAESYRYFIHKTSPTIGWIYAFGADGSIYSNYQSAANTYKGWRTIHDVKRKPLWTGSYYMTAGHTATPSKKLSACEHGWMLLWSDYDPDTSDVNNTDFCTTMIPNRNWAGSTWSGQAFYCDCPRYTAGTATDSESRIIKVLNVYDNKLVGTANNSAAPRNDVILRAVYEF